MGCIHGIDPCIICSLKEEKLRLHITSLKIDILSAELNTYDSDDEEDQVLAQRIHHIEQIIRDEGRKIA